MQKAPITEIRTVAGTVVEVQEFEAWNERMFLSYGNDRLYFHENLLVRRIQAKRIKAILGFLDIQPSDHLLDAGCGEGYLFTQSPICARQVGADISVSALKIAAERNSRAEWVRCDLHNMPFPNSTFDKICCSEVIEHLLDPMALLHELHRVMKPNGRLAITIPNEKTMNRLKDAILSTAWGRRAFPKIPRRTEWHLTEYTPALLLAQLQALFRVERTKVLPLPWLHLGYGVLCRPK